MNWIEVNSSDLLFWSGIALMVIALILAVGLILIFCITGRRLKKKLESEYGKPEQ